MDTALRLSMLYSWVEVQRLKVSIFNSLIQVAYVDIPLPNDKLYKCFSSIHRERWKKNVWRKVLTILKIHFEIPKMILKLQSNSLHMSQSNVMQTFFAISKIFFQDLNSRLFCLVAKPNIHSSSEMNWNRTVSCIVVVIRIRKSTAVYHRNRITANDYMPLQSMDSKYMEYQLKYPSSHSFACWLHISCEYNKYIFLLLHSFLRKDMRPYLHLFRIFLK